MLKAPEHYRRIPLTKGKFAIIDADLAETIGKYQWCVCAGYAVHRITANKVSRNELMHHTIFGERPKGMEIDHIDGNRLNNTRENLRACTHAQNMHNTEFPSRESSRRGVYKRGNRWRANLKFQGESFYIGSFKSQMDASAAYKRRAKQLHGDFFVGSRPAYLETSTIPILPRATRRGAAASPYIRQTRNGTWEAKCVIEHKIYQVGTFPTLELAREAQAQFKESNKIRDKAAKRAVIAR